MSPDNASDDGTSDPPTEEDAMESAETLRRRILRRLEEMRTEELRDLLSYLGEFDQTDPDEWPEPRGRDPVLEVAGIVSGEPVTSRELDDELYGDEST